MINLTPKIKVKISSNYSLVSAAWQSQTNCASQSRDGGPCHCPRDLPSDWRAWLGAHLPTLPPSERMERQQGNTLPASQLGSQAVRIWHLQSGRDLMHREKTHDRGEGTGTQAPQGKPPFSEPSIPVRPRQLCGGCHTPGPACAREHVVRTIVLTDRHCF